MIRRKTLGTTACVALCSATVFGQEVISDRLTQQRPNDAPRYVAVNLGTLGGTYSEGVGINNQGWLGGLSNLAGDKVQHGVVWATRGRQRLKMDLGTLGGPNSLTYARPTATGEVAGFSETHDSDPLGEDFCPSHWGTGFSCLPFLWRAGIMTALPTLGGNNAFASTINNRGQVSGTAENGTHDRACESPQVLQFKPVIWEDGRIKVLSTFPGDAVGWAAFINDSGEVVGSSGDCGTGPPSKAAHALLWKNGARAPVDLGNLGGTTGNRPQCINNRGEVVGFSNLRGDEFNHAFLWRQAKMTDLGTLPGDSYSFAIGINDNSQVVGFSCDADFNCRAFLWQHGTMTDLNTLLPPGSALYLVYADDINNRGEIVGMAYDPATGDIPAFLAVPGPEEGDNSATSSAMRFDPAASVALPEDVRNLIQQRLARR